MRAAIYARVSTEDQEKEGTSLDSQREACLKKSTELGWEVNPQYLIREVCSGLTMERPELTRLRESVRRKEIDGVIVYSTDRLSRDPVHLLILVEEFEKKGAKLVFVTEPLDNTLEGQLLGFVKGWASKVEAVKIRERTMRGRMYRAREGRQPGGRALYGYSLVEGNHIINEDEAKVVQMVFGFLANDGMTLRGIQKKLNGMGIPTRNGTTFWQHSVLHRIVRERAYTGEWYYNKTTSHPQKSNDNQLSEKVKPKEMWVASPIPALISCETFEASQRQLARNAERCNRNIKRQYLLSGLIKCGKCGYNYNARTMRDTIYYTCNSKLGHVNAVNCKSPGIRGDAIEPLVCDSVKKLLSQPKLIIQQLENRASGTSGSDYLQESLKSVGQSLAKKNMQIDKLLEAYTIGAIDAELLKSQTDKVRADQQKLTEAKRDLERQLQEAASQQINADYIEKFCDSISSVFGSLTFAEKRFVLREILDKVVIDDKGVTIYGIIPIYEEGTQDVSIVTQSSSHPDSLKNSPTEKAF